MNNIVLITLREYKTQARRKVFILMTLLAPLLIAGLIFIVGFLFSANESIKNIAVIDYSKQFNLPIDFKSTRHILFQYYTPQQQKQLEDTLAQASSIDGLLVIPQLEDTIHYKDLEKKIKLLTYKEIGINTENTINHILIKKIQNKRLYNYHLTTTQLKELTPTANIKIINLKNGIQGENLGIKQIVSYVLLYMVFMFIMIYGVRVMRSVIEEKNNRVVEIIISSVKPFELMMGKILGTTLVALTQFAIWITMFLVFLVIINIFLDHPQTLLTSTTIPIQRNISPYWITDAKSIVSTLLSMNIPQIVFVFLFYFMAGYLFYSSFFAAIGSAVDNETETSQFTPILLFPLSIGLYSSFSIASNPDGPVAFWASMIPITSPIAMVARTPYGIPPWQIILSITILLTSIIFMVYLAAKIYRTGILMYGKKTTFKELFKWIKN